MVAMGISGGEVDYFRELSDEDLDSEIAPTVA